MLRPLRVWFDHAADGLGLANPRPRISWQLPPGITAQHAYELELHRAGTTETFRGAGDRQHHVDWPTAPLTSRERVRVRVRVWGEGADGPSDWSEPVWAEAALLDPADWLARPVGAGWPEAAGTERRPARVRREFVVDRPIASARLYATAHGVFEAELNGDRVGDGILDPGWTVYSRRLCFRTYDVTAQLVTGVNVLGAWLGDGWYRGRVGFDGGTRDIYGTEQAFLAQLELTHDDGSRTVIATDETWLAARGPILTSGLYDGEVFDARLTEADWSPVAVHERDPATLFAAETQPVRCTGELSPVTVTPRPDGRLILDFGQNIAGRLALLVDGPAGTRVTLRHAEVLVDGELATGPLRQARATDEYILDGSGPRRWEPRFTIHGFRYAEVTGWPGELTPGAIVARVYHTDMRPTGWFECSDPLVSRLHDNVRWSMRGNFVHLPTDCPARDERLGWTGDVQVFAPTATFLYDSTALLDSWLADVDLEQASDGTVPWYVPVIPGGPIWTPIRPGAAWGDVVTLTPWALYQRTGDVAPLRRHHRAAVAWVELLDRLAGPSHLWDTGIQLGDWLDPSAPPAAPGQGATDPHLIATAYFAWSAQHLARAAEVLGEVVEHSRYAALARAVGAAFRRRYLLDGGRLTSDSPTAYTVAIAFGLLPDPGILAQAGDRLAELVRQGGYHIATGFVGTPLICDALTSTGHVAEAYGLLTQTQCPSWLYPVTQGATTIWERWDSLRPDGSLNPGGMTSFNHFALGSIADWLHRVVAGLAPATPGYRRIRFHPRPGGGLRSASAAHETPFGLARIAWERDGERLRVELTVPPGCTAEAILPGLAPHELGPGTHVLVTRFEAAPTLPGPRDGTVTAQGPARSTPS